MTRKATSIEILPDYQLRVDRNDGSSIVLDLAPYLEKGVFRALRDTKILAQVTLDPLGGAEWPCGASLPPELLAAEHSPASGRSLQRS